MTDDEYGRDSADDPASQSEGGPNRSPTEAPDGRSHDGPARGPGPRPERGQDRGPERGSIAGPSGRTAGGTRRATDDGAGRRPRDESGPGFLGSVREALIDPDRFYAREPSLAGGAAVVALNTALLLVFMRVFLDWIGTNFPDRVVSEAWGQLFVSVLLGGLVGWLLVAGVAHAVSAFLGGKGAFGRTLANVGWGFTPQLVIAPIQVALVLAFTSSTEPPTTDTSLAAFERLLVEDPTMQVAALVGLAATAWSVYLWYHGLRHARTLTSGGAIASVALPALWMIYQQLQPFLAG